MIGAQAVLAMCRQQDLKISTAESCTGGMIAAAITDIPGSSEVFERGFVTYSNRSKVEMLGVPEVLIEQYGAVSAEVAEAMAIGVLAHSQADISVAVTGIAGPGGGSADKPVGLVFIAAAQRSKGSVTERHLFSDDRHAVREAATETALQLLLRQISA